MSKETLEHLSALMDGELSRETSLFVTRRLSADEALGARWERYHLIRDCIRQPGSKQVVTGLRARVSASLAADAAPISRGFDGRRWLKPVSGLAIAASVAVMAIMVTAPQPGAVPATGDEASTATANQPFVSPNALPVAPASQAVSFEPADQLNVYLVRHNQVARTAGRQGFVSFVPIVATPVEAVAEDEANQASENGDVAVAPDTSETP
jgi:sigma-E factor negative regulatory protein RseA